MAVVSFRPKPPPKRPLASSLSESLNLRNTYTLTPEETGRFNVIRNAHWPREGFAMSFWKGVAVARGLDPATVVGNPAKPLTFSALPWNHGKHWCWPEPLVILKKVPPKYLEENPHG